MSVVEPTTTPGVREDIVGNDTLARALAFALSAETLVVELGTDPEGLCSKVFTAWLSRVKPLPYSSELFTLVYEMLPSTSFSEFLEAIGGEEELAKVLEAAMIEKQDDVIEEALTEYIEARLASVIEEAGEELLGILASVVEGLEEKGYTRRKALTAVLAHMLNRIMLEHGM